MMNKKVRTLAIAVPVTVAVVAGAVRIAADYRSGSAFKPFETDREMQNNQVLFPENDSAAEPDRSEDGSSDSFWENDSGSDDSSSTGDDSGFLFTPDTIPAEEGNAGAINNGSLSPAGPSSGAAGEIYDTAPDGGHADVVLPGDGSGSGSGSGSGTGTGDSDSGSGSGSGGAVRPDPTPQPSPAPTPTPSGGGSDDDGDSGSVTPDPTPDPAPGGEILDDPDEDQKNNPSNDPYIDSDKYTEDVTPLRPSGDDGSNESVVITKPWNGQSYLYAGQSVSRKMIYNSLNTYVIGSDRVFYLWGEDEYGKYITVDAVSFDGETWAALTDESIVTIPSDAETMYIKVSYRLHLSDSFVERTVEYSLEKCRIFILSSRIPSDGKLDPSAVLNSDPLNQYLSPGSSLNLTYWMNQYLPYGERLTALFPGWEDAGVPAGWFYTIPNGRHVLEPRELVPIDYDKFDVRLQLYWLDENFDEGFSLGYLQTLCGVSGTSDSDILEVPEYTQAIDISLFTSDEAVSVSELKLPDTVVAFSTKADSLLHVEDAYTVSEGNPKFASRDGMLMSRDLTKIVAIPYRYTEVTVDGDITSVSIPYDNKIEKIILEGTSLPTINYDALNGATVVVPAELFDELLSRDSALLESGSCKVVRAGEKDAYNVKNHVIFDSDGVMRGIASGSGATLILPDEITKIPSGVITADSGVTVIVMPLGGNTVELEDGCFIGSALYGVACVTKEQYDLVRAELDKNGPEDIIVRMLGENTTADGSVYMSRVASDGSIAVSLVKASSGLTEFTGTLTASDGKDVAFTEIGDSAFEGCQSLRYVSLPESVNSIGYRAFYDCPSLELVFSDCRDIITVGDEAFEKCPSLHLLAFNAPASSWDNLYTPVQNSNSRIDFYAPTGSMGYPYTFTSFSYESGVDHYELVSIGETGKAVFGCSADGTPWIMIRSLHEVDGTVTLPATTVELWGYAFYECDSPSGGFTVNFGALDYLALNDCAFASSGISGSIELPEIIYLGESIFSDCKSLTDVAFGYIRDTVDVPFGIFSGCDNLSTLTFVNNTPPQLYITVTATSSYFPFQFNNRWTVEEEREKLRIIVPDSDFVRDSYGKTWRYAFAGFVDTLSTPAYLNMWNTIRRNMRDPETLDYPTDAEVDAELERQLLEAENRVRTLIDAPLKDAAENVYHYRLDDTLITLTGASPDIKTAGLYDTELGLLSGWGLDYVASGAFSRCKNLEDVMFPEGIAGIYDGAFTGVESAQLTLIMAGDTPPQLLGFEVGTPYSFGIDDEHILVMTWMNDEAYIRAWLFPMAGFNSLAEMQAYIPNYLLEKNGSDATDEEIESEINSRLLAAENRLRSLLGMELIDSVDDMIGLTDPGETDLPDFPDWPDLPEWPDSTPDYYYDAPDSYDGTSGGSAGDASDDESAFSGSESETDGESGSDGSTDPDDGVSGATEAFPDALPASNEQDSREYPSEHPGKRRFFKLFTRRHRNDR